MRLSVKVRRYYRLVKAARMWISLIRQAHEACDKTPIEDRGPIIEQLRGFEGMLGNVVATLVGVYSLDSGLWWEGDD